MSVDCRNDAIDAAFSLCAIGRLPARESSTSSSSTASLSDESEVAHKERSGKKTPPKKRPKQGERISLEEMKRLMRVYGPTKCLRNRTPKGSGKCTKAMSVKRKFFRWFPDFREQFVLQEGGWYKPVRGHREEMQYRADSRRRDQEVLVGKRIAKRAGSPKKKTDATAGEVGEV